MGRRHKVRCSKEDVLLGGLFGEDVERRPRNVTLVEGLAQSDLVHQTAPGAVDDAHALLGLGDGFGRQDVAGLVGQGRVQGDEVGAGEKIVQLHLLHPELHGALGGQERVIGDHLHPQAIGAVGDDGADIAAADQAQRLGRQLHAHEAVLLPLAGLGGLVGFRQLAGEGEDQGDGVLGGGDGVAEGGVHHHDPGLGGGGNVDIVDADARPADDLQRLCRRDHVGVGLGGGTDGQTVILTDDLQEFSLGQAGLHIGLHAAGLEDGEGGGGEFICDQDLGRHVGLLCSKGLGRAEARLRTRAAREGFVSLETVRPARARTRPGRRPSPAKA